MTNPNLLQAKISDFIVRLERNVTRTIKRL